LRKSSSCGLHAHPFAPSELFDLFVWSADQATRHPFAVSRGFPPSRKIEFGPTRRPRNRFKGVQPFGSRRPQLGQGPAGRSFEQNGYIILRSGSHWRPFLHKMSAAPVYRQQKLHQLARHRNSCPVAVAPRQFFLLHRSQLRIPIRRYVRRFNQHGLQMLVAFLGDRTTVFLACRFPLSAA